MTKAIYISVVGVLVASIVYLYFATVKRSESVRFVKELAYVLNQDTPKLVDPYTVLEEVYADQVQVILRNTMSDDIPEYDQNEHRSRVAKNFQDRVCNVPRFKAKFIEPEIKLIHLYETESKNVVSRFEFSIKDCI